MNEVTRILSSLAQGDPKAAEELLPIVYDELRRLAARKMAREPRGQTLQATALVHEAYIRLACEQGKEWKNRGHFYAVAAEVMRRILVDRARKKRALKHGGHLERVALDAVEIAVGGDETLILQVHDALEQLAIESPTKAEVVKLRFFVGLSSEETANLLGVSKTTVRRQWAFAKARLYQLMKRPE